jgi:hypothetical protein
MVVRDRGNYDFVSNDWIRLESIINDLSSRILVATNSSRSILGLGDTDSPTFKRLTLTQVGPTLSPLVVTSQVVVTNLNANYLQGHPASDFLGSSGVIADFPLSGTGISSSHLILGHNTTNLKLTANQLNTIQNIDSTASPTFVGLTLGGVINNTLLAADTSGLTIDGDTNPVINTGSLGNLNFFKRTISGSGILPIAGIHLFNGLTWTYDFSGTTANFAGAKTLFVLENFLKFSGNITLTSTSGITNPSLDERGNYSTITHTGSINNASTKNFPFSLKGAQYSVSLSNAFNRTGSGTITANVYGGLFSATGTAVTLTGGSSDVSFNYYGGQFQVVGSTVGTSIGYGGYFDCTGCDTNYDIYAKNATSVNYFAGPIKIGIAPTANSSGTVAIVAKDANLLTNNAGWVQMQRSDGTVIYLPYWL